MKTIRERMNPPQELSETYERNGLPDEDHQRYSHGGQTEAKKFRVL